MAGPNAAQQADEEKPLDPAAERLRRKLVRFMAINLSVLFIAVMAVVLALVYRSLWPGEGEETSQLAVPSGESLAGVIRLPEGGRIVTHALSGNRLTLHLRLADGSEAIILYDLAEARQIGRFEVAREAP